VTPRMRTARVAVVAAAAIFLAGCSGKAGDEQPREATGRPAVPPPTSAGYSESLRELCGRTTAAHDAVGIATSPDELVRKLPRTAAIDRRFLAELKRLVAPAGVAADASRLVALFGRVNANEDLALEHLRLKNFNGYFQFMDSALVVRLETDRIALRLAAPACTFRPFRGR
jgi:hypothetical protein